MKLTQNELFELKYHYVDRVVDSILEKIEALSDVCECNNGD